MIRSGQIICTKNAIHNLLLEAKDSNVTKGVPPWLRACILRYSYFQFAMTPQWRKEKLWRHPKRSEIFHKTFRISAQKSMSVLLIWNLKVTKKYFLIQSTISSISKIPFIYQMLVKTTKLRRSLSFNKISRHTCV